MLACLHAAFAETALVKVHDDRPDELLIDIEAAPTDRLDLYIFASEAGDQARLVATLDNLGKGAAGAAVQNLNIMAGCNPLAGLSV